MDKKLSQFLYLKNVVCSATFQDDDVEISRSTCGRPFAATNKQFSLKNRGYSY